MIKGIGWRVDYRIFASLLYFRFVYLAASHISFYQVAFVPQREMGDNIRTLQQLPILQQNTGPTWQLSMILLCICYLQLAFHHADPTESKKEAPKNSVDTTTFRLNLKQDICGDYHLAGMHTS